MKIANADPSLPGILCLFWSFEIVSSFGFRIWDLILILAPFAPLRAQFRFFEVSVAPR
jgi:hypothetical protein